MKKLIALSLLVTFINPMVRAQSSDPTEKTDFGIQHWVNKKDKTVQFVVNSKILVTLQKVKLDAKTGGILYVNLEQSNDELKENIRVLESQYPGYDVKRVWAQKAEDLNLDVPLLNLASHTVKTMPGMDGPYFQTMFEVSRAKISALEKELKENPAQAVKVSGLQQISRQKNVLKERVILPYTTCTLLAESKTLYGAIKTYLGILAEQKNYPYLYSSTKTQLEKQILVSCLDIQMDKELNSFTELLDKNVSLKPNALPPVGETYAKEYVAENHPVRYVIKTEVIEEN